MDETPHTSEHSNSRHRSSKPRSGGFAGEKRKGFGHRKTFHFDYREGMPRSSKAYPRKDEDKTPQNAQNFSDDLTESFEGRPPLHSERPRFRREFHDHKDGDANGGEERPRFRREFHGHKDGDADGGEERPRFRREFHDHKDGDADGGEERPRFRREFHDHKDGDADGGEERPRFRREFHDEGDRPFRRPDFVRQPLPTDGLPLATRHRIAVFGGTFDPIHMGHIQIARHILDMKLAEEVMFVPALIPPHKQEKQLASAEDRMEMLRLALEECRYVPPEPEPSPDAPIPEIPRIARGKEEYIGFSYSDIELKKAGQVSYTYDTLDVLKKVYSDCEFFFVMGMDSLKILPSWHRAAELVQNTQFIIYPRPDIIPPPYIRLEELFGPCNASKLMYSILPEEKVILSTVSSSHIREWLTAEDEELQEKAKSHLPESVWNYIRGKRLYLDSQP